MSASATAQLALEKPSMQVHLPVSKSHTPLLLQNWYSIREQAKGDGSAEAATAAAAAATAVVFGRGMSEIASRAVSHHTTGRCKLLLRSAYTNSVPRFYKCLIPFGTMPMLWVKIP